MDEPVRYDIDGFDIITNAILDLLNGYPNGESDIRFATLAEDEGIAMFPNAGAIIQAERVSITNHVFQRCLYPFSIFYRATGLSENRKIAVKEWMDTLGRWLEKQPIKNSDGSILVLSDYPALNDGRKIEGITRTSPTVLSDIAENQTQDWVINLQVVYTYEFDK